MLLKNGKDICLVPLSWRHPFFTVCIHYSVCHSNFIILSSNVVNVSVTNIVCTKNCSKIQYYDDDINNII